MRSEDAGVPRPGVFPYQRVRRHHTAAVLLTLLPCGWLAWVWFFLVARWARRPAWAWLGVVWLGTTISQLWLGWVIYGHQPVFAGYLIATWAAGIVVGFILRAHYLAGLPPAPATPPPPGWRPPGPALPAGWRPPGPALPAGKRPLPAGRRDSHCAEAAWAVVMGTIFVGAMFALLVVGVSRTVQAVDNMGYSGARVCAATVPLRQHGCVHEVQVTLLRTETFVQYSRGGVVRDLNVFLSGPAPHQEVTIGANGDWAALRRLPPGIPLTARYYNGVVAALRTPTGTIVATNSDPGNELVHGLLYLGLPLGTVLFLLLIWAAAALVGSKTSRARQHAGRVLINVILVAVLSGVTAAQGITGGWHGAIIGAAVSVVVIETLTLVARLYERRHRSMKAGRPPAPGP